MINKFVLNKNKIIYVKYVYFKLNKTIMIAY